VDPGLRQAYFALVEMALDDRDFAATARLLTEIETRVGLKMTPEKAPVFEAFVKSPEYESWLKERRPR